MPIYRFKCTECGQVIEKVLPMSQSQSNPQCEQCDHETKRDYGSEHAHASADSYTTPLHSDSLAIAPCQIEEHQRRFPDIRIDKQCRPVFEKFSQHQKYLDACGIVKNTNRHGKRRATKIS